MIKYYIIYTRHTVNDMFCTIRYKMFVFKKEDVKYNYTVVQTMLVVPSNLTM
ncbi:hypothetical protein ML8HA_02846 [Lactococcus lactis]|nr:hypothetical protein [Lactococcus lactis]